MKFTMRQFYFISLCSILSFLSCKKDTLKYPEAPATTTLLTAITLDVDSTTLHLEDFVFDASKIDSIHVPLPMRWDKESRQCILQSTEDAPMLTTLQLFIEGQKYDLLLKKSLKKKVSLQYVAEKTTDKVQLKGEMTAWAIISPTKSERKEHTFTFAIPPGNYQYIYIVNDKETLATNAEKIDNNIGGFNSLLKIKGGNKQTILKTYSHENNKITLYSENVKNLVVFWENIALPATALSQKEEKITITIPKVAQSKAFSFLRVWGNSDDAFSNDIIIPLKYGKIVTKATALPRQDRRKQVLYSLMIDRFKNGKTDNDHPLKQKNVLPQANYQGGDLVGITQKIKDGYFSSLGINSLWISPITQNPEDAYGQWTRPKTKFSGYHGYWPISSSKVDYRFGTTEELHELLKTAHAHNMNVFLDYVANHVHEEHPFYKQHPNWVTDLYLPDGTKNTQLWDNQRLTTWFDDFMPTLDLENDTVMEMMTDSALFWVENYAFDGFRHDATKHIPLKFWRTLTEKIRHSNNPNVYQIGETYGSRELIASYVSSGLLDAQFDFNLYDNAVACFARPQTTDFSQLQAALQESFNYFGYHHLMGNISGNHDRSRFISYASGDVKFEEDAKLAGWTRNIILSDTSAYAKLVQLNAFNLTIPGVPVIYQGDEYGVPGGNDPDNRRMMQFENLNAKEMQTRNQIAAIAQLRNKNMPLIYGDFTFLETGKDVFAYLRSYFNKGTVVIFNKSKQDKKVTLQIPENLHPTLSLFGSSFEHNKNVLTLTIPKNSCEIIY